MHHQRFASALIFLFVSLAAACGDDDHPSSTSKVDGGGVSLDSGTPGALSDASRDASTPIDVGDGAVFECVSNPITYSDILNACTDAEKVTKNPTLPLIMVDGGLPPLP